MEGRAGQTDGRPSAAGVWLAVAGLAILLVWALFRAFVTSSSIAQADASVEARLAASVAESAVAEMEAQIGAQVNDLRTPLGQLLRQPLAPGRGGTIDVAPFVKLDATRALLSAEPFLFCALREVVARIDSQQPLDSDPSEKSGTMTFAATATAPGTARVVELARRFRTARTTPPPGPHDLAYFERRAVLEVTEEPGVVDLSGAVRALLDRPASGVVMVRNTLAPLTLTGPVRGEVVLVVGPAGATVHDFNVGPEATGVATVVERSGAVRLFGRSASPPGDRFFVGLSPRIHYRRIVQPFSNQGRAVGWTPREVALRAYALDRLAEEESRQTILKFPVARPAQRLVQLPGEALEVGERVSVAPVPVGAGLYRMEIELVCGTERPFTLARLVVDRDDAGRHAGRAFGPAASASRRGGNLEVLAPEFQASARQSFELVATRLEHDFASFVPPPLARTTAAPAAGSVTFQRIVDDGPPVAESVAWTFDAATHGVTRQGEPVGAAPLESAEFTYVPCRPDDPTPPFGDQLVVRMVAVPQDMVGRAGPDTPRAVHAARFYSPQGTANHLHEDWIGDR